VSKIFISYRRDDSAANAGRLYDSLCARFGAEQVFMDVDGIKLGDDFVKVLDDTEKVSSALVIVIGPNWVTKRLFDPQDFVRREILVGLMSSVRVFPVLVSGSHMPQSGDLPEDLAPLARVQALAIRDEAFHRDADQLIGALNEVISRSPPGADFTGEWRATVEYSWGDTYQEVFTFELDDGELLGAASYVGTPRAIQDGKISGNKITFQTKSLTMLGDKTYEEKHQYSGKLVDGQIKFRLQTETGYDTRLPEIFTAARR
jgi:TIR domain